MNKNKQSQENNQLSSAVIEEKFKKSQTALDEQKILEFWNENKIFEKSIENRKGKKEFTFYDGPPFATGLPHYGHLLAGTIKDVIPRHRLWQGTLLLEIEVEIVTVCQLKIW